MLLQVLLLLELVEEVMLEQTPLEQMEQLIQVVVEVEETMMELAILVALAVQV